MRKLGICLVLVFFVVGVSCFAQSNNDAQRIVGTWNYLNVSGESLTIVFNSNGTYSWINYGNGNNSRYFISAGKLILNSKDIFDYYLSPDGKVLFLISSTGYKYWVDKK